MLLLQPYLRDALWGGNRLFTKYRKGSGERLAESWEFSTHADGHSHLMDGSTLQDRLAAEPWLAGNLVRHDGMLPILAKLIDARLPLSVQVHPGNDDTYINGNKSGKTEYWYILDAEPGAWIYHGLRKPITHAELEVHAREGTIESALRKVPVRAGDAFFIPGGTLHAIGGGILCFELQQNSNVTYRVYDYGRRDHRGKERTLHLREALNVANLAPTPSTIPGLGQPRTENGLTRRMMVDCAQFAMEELTLNGEGVVRVPSGQFAGLFLVEGQYRIESRRDQGKRTDLDELSLMPGQTVFLASQETVLLQGKGRAFLMFPPRHS